MDFSEPCLDCCSRGQALVLDDDCAVRHVLSRTLTSAGYEVISFSDRSGLLAAAARRTPACILLDVSPPLQSGLVVLSELREQNYNGPILMMSGNSDIATAVRAVRLGAADFIEKPFRTSDIIDRVSKAIETLGDTPTKMAQTVKSVQFPGRELLSNRELDVLQLLLSGATSKESSRVLGISPRTVEDHRNNMIRKLGVRRCADVVRVVIGSVTDLRESSISYP